MCMKVGDLVIVRLEETGTARFLLPGIIVNKTLSQKLGKKRFRSVMLKLMCRLCSYCCLDLFTRLTGGRATLTLK